LAAGHEIMLPKTVVDRLAAGQKRDMTQAELAVSAGITQGYLSELEAGKRKGPVALHQRIARALGTPIHLLLPITVSEQEADPARFARRRQVIKDMQRTRRRR